MLPKWNPNCWQKTSSQSDTSDWFVNLINLLKLVLIALPATKYSMQEEEAITNFYKKSQTKNWLKLSLLGKKNFDSTLFQVKSFAKNWLHRRHAANKTVSTEENNYEWYE